MEFSLFLLVTAKVFMSAKGESYRSHVFTILHTGNIAVNHTSVWQENTKNEVTCTQLCLSDSLCTSILYNTEDRVCYGYHCDSSENIIETESLASNMFLVRANNPDNQECETIDYRPPHYAYNMDVCLCYRVDLGPLKSLSNALAECQSEGARLLRITSRDVQTFLESEVEIVKDFHIDGKEGYIPGEWFFSNGDKITTFFWPEEYMYTPVDGPSCLVLDRFSKKWINKDCGMTEHFICQYNVNSLNEDTVDDGSAF